MTAPGPRARAALVAGVVVLHFGVYRLVNQVNAGRSASALLDLSTSVDHWLPYLGWTWVVYYVALPYVMAFGSLAVLRLPPRLAVRAAGTYVVMTLAGGALQLFFPAQSPWPAEISPVQRFFHESVSYDPFVCLPSMHVALVTLTACLVSAGSPTARTRIAHGAVAALVSLSTLTLKEHYVWDVVAGGLLAGAAFALWRRGAGPTRLMDRASIECASGERSGIMSTVEAAIDPSRLFRLPWTASDNAMTWLEPTRRCNITCDACFAANDPRSEKSVERFRKELEETLRLRRCDAVLIGGGEPLTHPYLADIVAAVAAKGVKPVLITNGVGLEACRLRELKKAGLQGVTFHVDSHQRRPGWQGKDEAALNVLREEFADLLAAEGDLTCAFNTTIFPDTLAMVPAIVAWAIAHPDKVHVLTLICVRMADPDGPFTYEVAGRPVDLARTPYAASVPCGNVTSEQLAAGIRDAVPGFEFCGFLGGTVHPHALKWVIGSHLCTAGTSFGSFGPRTMELIQNGHHALWGRYLAHTHPRDSRRGRFAFLLAVFDPSLRHALRRYLATVVRHPAQLARRVHIQSLSIVQPVDTLPNGEMDICDGCPNRTFWNGRLVPACRLEEYQIHGAPFTAIPRGA